MRYFSLLILLFVTSIPSFADDGLWAYQEQCVSRASVDSWSFAGTILLTGYGGLHGINREWETPRVLARIPRYSDGRLSPDQRWYAEVEEDVIYSESFNHEHVIRAINIYSTSGDNIVYSIPWQNSWLQMWGYREIFWLNNKQILYEYSDDFAHDLDELRVINPQEGTTATWDTAIDILEGGSGFQREYVQYPSPDFKQSVNYSYDPDENRLHWAIYNVDDAKPLKEIPTRSGAIFTWLPDSSGFIGEIIETDETNSLIYFNKDGSEDSTIMTLNTNRIRIPSNFRFSSDGKYLAIKVWRGNLLIADMEKQEVTDTCLSAADSITWSFDDSQIAFIEPGTGTQNVFVFDLESWSYRPIARHIIQTTYWDKVIGWRNN